jgi:hypothetical protein
MAASKSEKTIKAEIQISLSRDRDVRVFNQPVGLAWSGKTVARKDDRVILDHAQAITMGLCEGSSDLIGWVSREITQDMVGKRVAQFLAIETKSKSGRPSDEQKNFIAAVKKAGGAAGIARTDADAWAIITGADPCQEDVE